MRTLKIPTFLFAGLLMLGTVTSVAAQTEPDEQDAHHPADAETAPAPMAPGEAPAATGPGGMPDMGMMTPEMMQMMQRMMDQGGMSGMMGGMTGQGMTQDGMGPGMSAQGQMPMAGMMMCPMMQMMMGDRAGMGMPGMMTGPGILYGMPNGTPEEMTIESVRTLLEQDLTQHGNPRLKLGEVATAADGSITAEIITVDGSLVQKLAFNRYPGLVRQVD
ncbi:MAG: hypothetical protein SGJ07_03785 [Rhodospirillaceae bacterium]|nr:hypothetical protein [Rhodospirillaceae bacterium]